MGQIDDGRLGESDTRVGADSVARDTTTPDAMAGVMGHALWNTAALLLPGLYSIAIVAYLLRAVGPAGYAPWAFAIVMLGWLALLDTGLGSTTTREAARALAGDEAAVRRLNAANGAYATLGILAGIAGLLVSGLAPAVLRLAGDPAREAVAVGAILSVDYAIVLSTAGWSGIIRGARRFDRLFLVNVIHVVVAGTVLVLIAPEHGIVGVAFAQPVGRAASRLAMLRLLPGIVPWFHARPRWPGWAAIRSLWAFSLPIMAMQVATQVGMGTDVIVVGMVAGATGVGLYAAGSQLIRYVALLLFPAFGVVLPQFSSVAYRRPEEVGPVLRRFVRLVSLVATVVFGGLALHAEMAAELWSGQTDAVTVWVLFLYAVTYVFIAPAHVTILMLIARGRHALIGAIVLVEALANLALSIVLIHLIGPIGVALSTLLVVTVDDLVVIPIVASRLLDISFVGLVRSFALGIGGGVAILAATMLVPGDGLLTLVIRGALSGSALVLLLRHAVRASAAAGRGESLPLASRGPEP